MAKSPEAVFQEFSAAMACVEVENPKTQKRSIGSAFHVGSGVFVTAAHVVRDKKIIGVSTTRSTLERQGAFERTRFRPRTATKVETFFHSDPEVDVACFKTDLQAAHVSLAISMDDTVGIAEDDLHVLQPIVIMGYPPIPGVDATLVATSGEVNAAVRTYDGRLFRHYVVSQIARGGFSGGPALLLESGVCLGLVTDAFVRDGQPAEQGFFIVLSSWPILTMLREHDLIPPEQAHVLQLFNVMAAMDQSDDAITFSVRGWDANGRASTFEVSRDREAMLKKADDLAAEHSPDEWTVFRVFERGVDDAIYEQTVPDDPHRGDPRREPD